MDLWQAVSRMVQEQKTSAGPPFQRGDSDFKGFEGIAQRLEGINAQPVHASGAAAHVDLDGTPPVEAAKGLDVLNRLPDFDAHLLALSGCGQQKSALGDECGEALRNGREFLPRPAGGGPARSTARHGDIDVAVSHVRHSARFSSSSLNVSRTRSTIQDDAEQEA